ncbi:MAG: DUF4150 domain-containing protein [Alcanivorax sp.]|nr:DUF4150 domain-containing protein [Alcanivorax sp.]
MSNILINGRTAVHAKSGGTVNSPDVCKTPPYGSPSTFTNVAASSDATGTASTVFINGQPACHMGSSFAVSQGDEGGSYGGTTSGTHMGPAEFITASSNVFIEGQPAVRQGDMMVSNNRNTPPMPLQQPPAGLPRSLLAGATAEQTLDDPAEQLPADDGGNSSVFNGPGVQGDDA